MDAENSVAHEIDAIIAQAGGWRGETLARVRRVITVADADIVEEIKWRKPSRPEGVATWVCAGNVCMADVLKSAVRLTFPQGARVADPTGSSTRGSMGTRCGRSTSLRIRRSTMPRSGS